MLKNGMERGFTESELDQLWKQEIIGRDSRGYYIHTAYENDKVYFEDYYRFLEKIELKSLNMIESANWSISQEDKRDKLIRLYAEKLILLKILDLIQIHYSHYEGLELVLSPEAFWEYAALSIESIQDSIPRDRLEGNKDMKQVLSKAKEIYHDILSEVVEEFVRADQDRRDKELQREKDNQYFNQTFYE
jgi:hypothetical protein